MRVSISGKLFILFSALSLLTVLMGLVVLIGARGRHENTVRISDLKDLQLQVKTLQYVARTEKPTPPSARGSGLGRELTRTEQALKKIKTSDLPDEIRESLERIKTLSIPALRKVLLDQTPGPLPQTSPADRSRGLTSRLDSLDLVGARFQEVAEGAVTTLLQRDRAQLLRLQISIIAIILFALLLSLAFWFHTTRSLQRFLHNQRQAINSIKSGHYDYEPMHTPGDEFGDQMRLLRDLAANLDTTLRQLTESGKKYKQLVENVSDLVWKTDEQELCTYASPAIEPILGIKPETAIDKPLFELMPFIKGSDTNPLFDKIRSREPFTNLESLHRHQSGQVVVLESSGQPKFDHNGTFRGYHGVSRNISKRKQAEKLLRESRRFLQSVIDGVSDPIMVVNTDYRISLMNRAAQELSPRASLSQEGLFCHQISHNSPTPCDSKQHPCPLKMVRATGQPVTLCHEHSGPDNRTMIIEIRAYPLFDSNGEFTGIIESSRDISQRLAMEQQAFRTENEKQQLQHQLVQAQKLESLGRLAGGVAHDFNNLLTSIIGCSELTLMQLAGDHPARENIKLIHEAGQRAADLTRQLLTFSRKQVLAMKPIVLDQVVENMARLLTRMIGNDITLELKSDPQIRTIMADPSQLEQVLMNLAVNARDAMPDGGRLVIETSEAYVDENPAGREEELPPGPYMVLTVSDTGTGMTEEVREQIFEPFFTTKDNGSGLGLATVFGVIKQHKGQILVYSEPGEGTSFRIYLPIVETVADEKDEQSGADIISGGTETILLVDDDPLALKLMEDTLVPSGYTVHSASSGQQALQVAEEIGRPIQLLITDVIMPGMDGKTLAEKLEPCQTGLKILFISGYTDNIISSLGVETGDNVFFRPKPLSPSMLVRTTRAILDGREIDESRVLP